MAGKIDTARGGVAAIVLAEKDAVATALTPLRKGTTVTVGYPDRQATLEITEDIPIYHKVALVDLPAKSDIHKQGHVIGITSGPIGAGRLVHIHNLAGKDPGTDRPKTSR